ncbi:MAG: hydantoinase/oxoprolinase family protein [Acidobacteriota bacterium]
MVRIGVDTGGTFTDLVWEAAGRRFSHKVPSTPDDPSRAVVEGLRAILAAGAGRLEAATGDPAGGGLPPTATVVHGSTVATNALLEGRTARVSLVTNAGFEDLLDLGRQARPALYDASILPPTPLVARQDRIGVPGRLGPGGEEIQPLETGGLHAAVRAAVADGVERFAVCFLHSYAGSEHEDQAAAVIESAGGVASLSSRVLPEHREFERASTTVVNAAVAPVMSAYLERLEQQLLPARLAVFRSNGGILSASRAGEAAVHTLLSGPAAGVVGAATWGRRSGVTRLVTFDMGGTSTDVALCEGEPAVTTEASVAGYAVGVPLIDLHTIGAGGGSIARRDSGGALVVGPRSAGAEPGPACYGRGEEPTVTDAQVVLGRLAPSMVLGGSVRLDAQRARRAVGALADQLGLDLHAAAAGIVQVTNAAMERAIRVVSLARGYDPRDFTLLSFGGAGGLHAAEVAAGLDIPEVVVPPDAGVFSAAGMVHADVVLDGAATVLRPLAAVGIADRESLAAPLQRHLGEQMAGEGFDAAKVEFRRTLDLRYAGQSFEIGVPDGSDPAAAFHAAHAARHGHARPDAAIELVTLRVRAIGRLTAPEPAAREEVTEIVTAPAQEMVWIDRARRQAGFFRREELTPGQTVLGPAVVAEDGATTLVPDGWAARVDGLGNLRLRRRDARQPAVTS